MVAVKLIVARLLSLQHNGPRISPYVLRIYVKYTEHTGVSFKCRCTDSAMHLTE